MNITYKHCYFAVKHTTLDHRVLFFEIICLCMSRRDFKGCVFWLIKQPRVKICLLICENVLIHPWDISTGFGILLGNFPLKRKFPSLISRNIWKICVFQPLFITIYLMRRFESRGIFLGWLYLSHVWSELSEILHHQLN